MLYMRSSYLYLSLYSSTLSGHPSSSLLFSVAKLNPAESSGKTWERKRKGESQAERQGPRILANLSTHSSTCAAGCPKESVTAIYLNQSCEVEQTHWHSRNGISMNFHLFFFWTILIRLLVVVPRCSLFQLLCKDLISLVPDCLLKPSAFLLGDHQLVKWLLERLSLLLASMRCLAWMLL